MRLIYFGTADFAVPALRAIADSVVLVVSQPDRPTGRGLKLQASPVKQAALQLGLPIETPEKCRAPEFVERLRAEHADALLVAAYGQILSPAVLDSAKRGGINLHGSILPEYRGAAPIQRAILDGKTETGVTLMQMDKGMDTGDMIAITRTPIGPDETAGMLTPRLAEIAAELAREWMPKIVAGEYPRTSQDSEHATMAPKVTKAEAEIRFERSAGDEYNRFRAFTPAPGAYLLVGEAPVKLLELARVEGSGQPGTLIAINPEPVVAFIQGALSFPRVQPAGKAAMSGRDWVNGLRMKVGDRLGP
ncbi:MAG: methionyl-tRNA formyltransferase [Fimbriimonadaceae bacterium]|nr:methionyl-tRNA formyltransferase [Fimbriimonadaceae bacterium]